jgi:hypothetical protein
MVGQRKIDVIIILKYTTRMTSDDIYGDGLVHGDERRPLELQ